MSAVIKSATDPLPAFFAGRCPMTIAETAELMAGVQAKLDLAKKALDDANDLLSDPRRVEINPLLTAEARLLVRDGPFEVAKLDRTLAEIGERLEAAKKAKPAKLAAEKAAMARRDEVAERVAKELPALVASLTALLGDAVAADRELIVQAAVAEGKVDITPVFAKVAGRAALMDVKASNMPAFALHDLDGTQVWPVPAEPISVADVPAHLRVENVGAAAHKALLNAITLRMLIIAPGETVEAEFSRDLITALMGDPNLKVEAT